MIPSHRNTNQGRYCVSPITTTNTSRSQITRREKRKLVFFYILHKILDGLKAQVFNNYNKRKVYMFLKTMCYRL